jgi:hypothetical protein
MTYLMTASKKTALRILAAVLVIAPATAHAATPKPLHRAGLIVEQPANLPEAVQKKGDAMYFYRDNVNSYLYVEQEGGKRLVVLDITDPDRTKVVSQIDSFADAQYDFVHPVGDRAVLVRFKGAESHAAYAELDLRKAKKPTLRTLDAVPAQAHLDRITDTAYFVKQGKALLHTAENPDDVQLVDLGPKDAGMLTTIHGVNAQFNDTEQGRFFLLANDGLWIIRQPAVEEQYRLSQLRIN